MVLIEDTAKQLIFRRRLLLSSALGRVLFTNDGLDGLNSLFELVSYTPAISASVAAA